MSYNSKYTGKEVEEALDLAKTALQEHQDISQLATKNELNAKQDVISDLEAIREGASLGSTALQNEQYKGTISAVDTSGELDEPDLEYVTKVELDNAIAQAITLTLNTPV